MIHSLGFGLKLFRVQFEPLQHICRKTCRTSMLSLILILVYDNYVLIMVAVDLSLDR